MVIALLAMALSACGSVPEKPNPVGNQVAAVAQSMVGTPYRFGGASPAHGFDCSGLVHYAYARAGRDVPRTTEVLYARSHAVHMARLSAGDLLFFVIDNKPSHVGIYVGEGRFVHAPSAGKSVAYASLSDPYWQKRLVKIGRF